MSAVAKSDHKFSGIPFAFTHPKGGAGYQRDVPKAFKALVGRNRWTGYHPDASYADIKTWARSLAAQQDEQCAALAALPEGERAQLARDGGLEQRGSLASTIAGLRAMETPTGILANPERMAELSGRPLEQMEAIAYRLSRPDPALPSLVAQHARVEAVAVKVLPSTGEFSWQGLFNLWVTAATRKDVKQHPRTLRFLYRHLGDADYRHVDGFAMQAFIDKLGTVEGLSVAMVGKEKERVSGMYRAAKLHCPNPCEVVTVKGTHHGKSVEDYKGPEVRHILATAAATSFGGSRRHDDCLMALKVESLYGCRVNEAAQLQNGDICFEDGEWCIWFRQQCAVTGVKHSEKSIKTAKKGKGTAERRLPLMRQLWDSTHPHFVGDIRAYAGWTDTTNTADVRTDETRAAFMFSTFDYYTAKGEPKQHGRADYLIQNMGDFIRDVCKIKRANLSPNHSFRHRVNAALDNGGWDSESERERFLGQGGSVNRGYGSGKALRLAAIKLREVDPLADI